MPEMPTDAAYQPCIIHITGDDELSRLGRANDLMLIKCVRETCGLGLTQSVRIVKALRSLEFSLSDHNVQTAIAGIGSEVSAELFQAVRNGIKHGIAEIGRRSPFSTGVI